MKNMNKSKKVKKAQIDIAIVIGAIIIPVAALVGALMFAWLLMSPVVDLCRIAETISYDIVSLSDVAYSVPDDITIKYVGPTTCTFYSEYTFPSIVNLELMNITEPLGFNTMDSNWYKGQFMSLKGLSTLAVDNTPAGSYNWFAVDFSSEPVLENIVLTEVITLEPSAFPTNNSSWYTSPISTSMIFAMDIDAIGPWFAIDTNADNTYEITGKRIGDSFDINTTSYIISGYSAIDNKVFIRTYPPYDIKGKVVGDTFEIEGVFYTIQTPNFNKKIVALTKTTSFPTVKNTLSCMNQMLIVTDIILENQLYPTTVNSKLTRDFSFYAKSYLTGAIYDATEELWYSFPFKFRSFANPSDESLGVSTRYKIDDGVFIRKYSTAYYDTINSELVPSKQDASVVISRIALQSCYDNQSKEGSIAIPPQYKLNSTASEICIFWQSLPDEKWHKMQCFSLTSMESSSGCAYAINPVLNHYSKNETINLNLKTTYNSVGRSVVINASEVT